MDRFQEMRVFAAVVDAGSFVKAADALALSKAAVSRTVSELEARLGVRLLHRTTRRLSLTAEGDLFVQRCREVLASVEEAEAEITKHSGEAVGALTFGVLRLGPLWGGFLAAHPKTRAADSATAAGSFRTSTPTSANSSPASSSGRMRSCLAAAPTRSSRGIGRG